MFYLRSHDPVKEKAVCRRRETHARAGSRHSRSPHARGAGPVPRDAREPSRGGAPRVLWRHVGVNNLQAVDRVSRSCASSIAITVSPRPSAEASGTRAKRPSKSPRSSRRCSPREFARKWRRKGLERLNPRPEMVWPRKRRTPNIWYESATALSRGSRPGRPNWSRGRGAAGQLGSGAAKSREDRIRARKSYGSGRLRPGSGAGVRTPRRLNRRKPERRQTREPPDDAQWGGAC